VREQTLLSLPQAIQRHVALVSISATTVRGKGNRGAVAAARGFLAVLPLRSFGVSNEVRFQEALDAATRNLLRNLPKGARSWGLARKSLNIFLRDAFYNGLLASTYGLASSAPFYEIPLDGIVAHELRRRAGRGRLPTWLGVKRLTPTMSETYQTFALEHSRKLNIERVYLDTYLWVEGRERNGERSGNG
jgi:hypothetical protein